MSLHIAEMTVSTVIGLFFSISTKLCSTKAERLTCSGEGLTENTIRTENKSDHMLFTALEHNLYKNSMKIMSQPHSYGVLFSAVAHLAVSH